MNDEAVFVLLKNFKPKMKVNRDHQIRKGPHCPLTFLGKELGLDCKGADDFTVVRDELGLDEEFVDRFTFAADYSFKEMDRKGENERELRRKLFKTLKLPKSAL